MSDSINKYIVGEATIYTASMSPDLQGVELRQIWQLTTYTNLKIRGNSSFVRTVDKRKIDDGFFDDSIAPNNLGVAGTGSLANVDAAGLLGETISHVAEIRDLGQTSFFNDNEPFVEAADVETDPTVIIKTHPLELEVATSLVQVCSSPSSFDGAIEPFDIRRIVDRSSIELPYVARSVKSDLNITNVRRESMIIADNYTIGASPTRPFLDAGEGMGNIDMSRVVSDADPRILPFKDSDDAETFYLSGTLDDEIRGTLLSGFVSSSIRYTAAPVNGIVSGTIYSSRGFVFSQNNNNGYDSIAFGGLVRGNRVTGG
jgi:hypothetical protein